MRVRAKSATLAVVLTGVFLMFYNGNYESRLSEYTATSTLLEKLGQSEIGEIASISIETTPSQNDTLVFKVLVHGELKDREFKGIALRNNNSWKVANLKLQ